MEELADRVDRSGWEHDLLTVRISRTRNLVHYVDPMGLVTSSTTNAYHVPNSRWALAVVCSANCVGETPRTVASCSSVCATKAG